MLTPGVEVCEVSVVELEGVAVPGLEVCTDAESAAAFLLLQEVPVLITAAIKMASRYDVVLIEWSLYKTPVQTLFQFMEWPARALLQGSYPFI
jgi:hypothetical protein